MEATIEKRRDLFVGCDPAQELEPIALRRLEVDLRRAHALRRFELHYQPIVDVVTGRIEKAEALLRWNDLKRGFVPPSTFVPLLESTGLINEVGDWAVREAATTCRRWREAGCAPIRIAINVSPHQLGRREFADSFIDVVSGWSDESYGLDVEVTEGALEAAWPAVQNLFQLRERGVGVAIDDFGMGYSSLARVCVLPVDQFKVDRSFTSMLPNDERATAVVSMIVELARRFGATTVAEGVENCPQLDHLRRLGCDYSQGYLHYRPLNGAMLSRVLPRRSEVAKRAAAARFRRGRSVNDVERLADSLIDCIGYVSENAERVRSPAELPPILREIALATTRNVAWRAWSVDKRMRFVRVRLCTGSSSRVRAAVHASFYDMEGRCANAAIWEQGRDGRWKLYDVATPAEHPTPSAETTTLIDLLSETSRIALRGR